MLKNLINNKIKRQTVYLKILKEILTIFIERLLSYLKMNVYYDIDSTSNWITIQHQKNKYVFQRELVSSPKNDSIHKIFLTQLIFDYIIRHIHL